MERTVVIIPALNPLETLVDYVKKLLLLDISKVIVINDGSDEKYRAIFEALHHLENCIVLEHKVNKGKGRTLKRGFTYVLKELKKAREVITVGAHGQHNIEDVRRIIHNTKVFSDGIILGTRNFRSKEVPITNAIGNRAASMLFKILFQKRILDTQTGLRCIPRQELNWLVKVPGESYSYDTNVLVEAIKRNIPIYEIPIGHVRVKKNSIIQYDEIIDTQKVIQQMIKSYIKIRKHQS